MKHCITFRNVSEIIRNTVCRCALLLKRYLSFQLKNVFLYFSKNFCFVISLLLGVEKLH